MKIIVNSIAIIVFIAAGTLLQAHPLGNFSVNQHTRIEAGKPEIKIFQVVDLAEIPSFQLSPVIDSNKDGTLSDDELSAYLSSITADYTAKLSLKIDQHPVDLAVVDKRVRSMPGEGSLLTFRFEWDLLSTLENPMSTARIAFANDNYSDRIGWREIVVNGAGLRIFDSTAFSNTLSDELRAYPENLLSSPLAERSAEFSITNGSLPENAVALTSRQGQPTAPVQTDRLARLVSVPEITPLIVLFGLLVAFGLGAAHAMSPGHGKTVVGAYLVGSKGTAKHALFLGLTVTITHTLGVFALGLITLFASNYILPETLMPFLGFVSGLMVFFIGITMFKDRLFSFLGWKKSEHDNHHHDHGHVHDTTDHHHEHGEHNHDGITHTHGGSTHSHDVPDEISWSSLLTLGISGGLLPCPSALVLMLASISAGKIGYGLVLTLAFSFGLAATLTIVGLIFLNVRNLFGRTSLSNSRAFQIIPVFSAFVIAFVGAVICYNAIG